MTVVRRRTVNAAQRVSACYVILGSGGAVTHLNCALEHLNCRVLQCIAVQLLDEQVVY